MIEQTPKTRPAMSDELSDKPTFPNAGTDRYPADFGVYIPEGGEGRYPPCLIQVDAEGRMSHHGAQLIHPGILELIYESVHLEDGRYVLRLDKQVCQLEVVDTFFVVARAEVGGDDVTLILNDGSREPLDPASHWIGPGEVFYCRVKGGRFPARLLRPAYYQVAELVTEGPEGFVLELGGVRHPLPRRG
jgi:hypothetical protein